MKLSIISINYNNRDGLAKTISSVVSQTQRDFEWIIIDGGSTDGSKDLITDLLYNKESNVSYWCSEKDTGIYNAMNKGVAKANGDYLLFLNSGDCLFDSKVVQDFLGLICGADIIGGDLVVNGIQPLTLYNPEENDLDYDWMVKNTLLHPSTFIRRSLFSQYGGYDENLRIVSDWKWFLEVTIKYNCSYTHWRRSVSVFDTGGISENQEIRTNERISVVHSFLPRYRKCLDKRESRIQELDIPFFKLLSRKLLSKINKWHKRETRI